MGYGIIPKERILLPKPGKFAQNMEKVYTYLAEGIGMAGPIEKSNEEIAFACGFKKSRQVERYLKALKQQGRIQVKIDRFTTRGRGCWVNTRIIYVVGGVSTPIKQSEAECNTKK